MSLKEIFHQPSQFLPSPCEIGVRWLSFLVPIHGMAMPFLGFLGHYFTQLRPWPPVHPHLKLCTIEFRGLETLGFPLSQCSISGSKKGETSTNQSSKVSSRCSANIAATATLFRLEETIIFYFFFTLYNFHVWFVL